METRAHHVVVGAFVLLGLVAIAAFAVWLGRASLDRKVDRYEIVFSGAVTGLQAGSGVRYRGIPVGRVADLRIDPQDVSRILTLVELDAGTPVKTDTVASVEAQGITGLSLIQLEGGTQSAPPLTSDDPDHPPRIPSRPGAFQQLVQTTPELLARGVVLVERASALLNPDTVAAVGQTVENLAKLTDALATRSDGIEQTLADVQVMASDLRVAGSAIADLSVDAKSVLQTADGAFATLGNEGKITLEALAKASVALERVSTRLDTFLDDTTVPIADFSRTGLYELTQLVVEFRDLTATLSRVVNRFDRDPAGYVFGGTRRGIPTE
ncbi:MlaD family protein [Geminicoccus roseus]|uniref:MlaD family protein n=1 Tax=Geminicoccus roseus TaxID=404900 RepID=UPI0003FC292B|nr:MlaD family protein [Geminicoccus roseus]